jgi:hypothetical protein
MTPDKTAEVVPAWYFGAIVPQQIEAESVCRVNSETEPFEKVKLLFVKR